MPSGIYIRSKKQKEGLKRRAKSLAINNIGKKRNKKTKELMSLNHVGMSGKKHKKETIEKFKKRKTRLGKKHTEETKKKMRLKKKNYIPWNKGLVRDEWGGIIKNLKNKIRELKKYKEWRSKVFCRDNYQCFCGEKGYLEAHHIITFNEIIKLNNIKDLKEAEECFILWDINNGISLCKKCHKKIHKK